MKNVFLTALVAAVTFFGIGVDIAECQNCDQGKTMVASLVSPAQAATPVPKEIAIPKFCQDVVFVWYIEYDLGPMKVDLHSNPPLVGFYWGEAVRGSLKQNWGKQQAATTGRGDWNLSVPVKVAPIHLSVRAIASETYRTDSGKKVLWYYTWYPREGVDQWTSPEKKKC